MSDDDKPSDPVQAAIAAIDALSDADIALILMDPGATSRLFLQVGAFLAREMDVSLDQVIEYVRDNYTIGRRPT